MARAVTEMPGRLTDRMVTGSDMVSGCTRTRAPGKGREG